MADKLNKHNNPFAILFCLFYIPRFFVCVKSAVVHVLSQVVVMSLDGSLITKLEPIMQHNM